MKGIIGFFKKVILLGAIGALIYVLLSYHFIIVGKKIRPLKKKGYNMDYIIYSTQSKRPETILAIEPLWEAGIAQLLVEEGMMSVEELELYKEKRREKRY